MTLYRETNKFDIFATDWLLNKIASWLIQICLTMIYIFKTSVKTKNQVKHLKPHINKIVPVEKWNFDLDDCDKILRIDSEENIVLKIRDLLAVHEFYCEELE